MLSPPKMTDEDPEKSGAPRRSVRRWALEIALIVATFAAIHWWQTRPLASGTAPELKGVSVNGEPLELEELRGNSVLVHFWAEWCPVCRAEEGTIQSIAGDFPVITVAMQYGDRAEVLRYLEHSSLSFPTLADPHGEIAGDWGVSVVPTSFIIGPDGSIDYSEVGFTTEAGLRVRHWAAGRFH